MLMFWMDLSQVISLNKNNYDERPANKKYTATNPRLPNLYKPKISPKVEDDLNNIDMNKPDMEFKDGDDSNTKPSFDKFE